MNPYKVLGINKEASSEDIKKVYRDLSKKHHPDKADGNEEKFKEISAAYDILKNPEKKSQFDRFGEAGQPNRNGDAWGAHAWGAHEESIFNFFNKGNSRRRTRRVNPDVKSQLRISLSDSIFGSKTTHKISRILACKDCKSEGSKIGTEKKCTMCNGAGQRVVSQNSTTQFVSTCEQCQGEGKTYDKCKKCDGAGFLQKTEKIKVKIPKNIKENSLIRLKDKGNVVYQSDGTLWTGSHYLVVDYPRSETGILKDGLDLHTYVEASIDKILAEDEVTIKLFNRKDITLKLNSKNDVFKPYEIKTDFLNGGKVYVKVLSKIPSNDIDEDKRNNLVKALREAYGESESILYPTGDKS